MQRFNEEEILRNDAKERLQRLSVDRLRVANDFLAYLEEREENEATEELLNIEGFREAFAEAVEEVELEKTVLLTSIRRNV
ncbi:MAG: hypothetical protein IT327_19215 [Anaerolineae bacterium]|nr:hypothetical protein [Anaerolineae bacterium]